MLNQINQKIIQKAINALQKTLKCIYFFGFLWLGILFILSIPVWVPFYLLTSSMCRSLNFMKKIIQLPKQLSRPSLTEPIRYAIFKGNGKYLRNTTPEEDTFLYQLYDYAIRKFLSQKEINPDKKIAEIECQSLVQWNYFKNNGIKKIECLQSKLEILNKQKQVYWQISVKKASYDIEEFSQNYDTMIAFNIKQKLDKFSNKTEGKQNIDIPKILAFIKHNLTSDGYVIFGDFFEEEGEAQVLQDLFNAFGLQVQQTENILKNITYAQKLMKSRGRKSKKYWEEETLERMIRKIKDFFRNKRNDNSKLFMVFILKKVGSPNKLKV